MKLNVLLYFKLTKFIAVMMIVFVTVASYFLSLDGPADFLKVIFLIIGVGISSAGSLALNQYAEIKTDALMNRTKNRPLPSQQITPSQARLFGNLMMFSGYGLIWFFVNPLCAIATMMCGFSYLRLYTPLKSKSSLSTLSGSIPGALLPIMGWLAIYDSFFQFDQLDAPIPILLLTVILYIWQIPHSLVISIRYLEDYKRAGMKQLPIVSGVATANRHILLNLFLLFCVSLFPLGFDVEISYLYIGLTLLLHGGLFFVFLQYIKQGSEASLVKLHRTLLAYLLLLTALLFFFR